MKEMESLPRPDGDTEHDTDTQGTMHAKAMPEGELPGKPRKPIGADFSFDIEATGVLEKLERLYDEIEAGKAPPEGERVSEASEEVTEQDERELEEVHAEFDRLKAERKADPDFGPEYHLRKACEDAANTLYEMARAGYDKEDFLRVAKQEVGKIRAELDPSIDDERIMDELLARFEEERILGGKSEPRTKTVKLDLGQPPERDDETEETRLP